MDKDYIYNKELEERIKSDVDETFNRLMRIKKVRFKRKFKSISNTIFPF